MRAIDNEIGTKNFWKMLRRELSHEVYEDIEKLTGIPRRRLAFLKDPSFKGVHTMKIDEIKAFSQLLEVDPIELLMQYGCGFSGLSVDEANELAQIQGLTWDLVAHVA